MFSRAAALMIVLSLASIASPQPVDPARMIFFDWGKAELSGDAKSTLDRVTAEFEASGQPLITLRSHSDRSGSAATNLRVSRIRAAAAADYLRAKGVADDSIRIVALGESDLLIDTQDGVREIQNRRIEVIF